MTSQNEGEPAAAETCVHCDEGAEYRNNMNGELLCEPCAKREAMNLAV